MKLIAAIKLLASPEQKQALLQTLEQMNKACNFASEQAWQSRAFSKYGLQELIYYDLRKLFGLNAQVTIRCIGKVIDAYGKDKKKQRQFYKHGAVPYDDRILTWRIEQKEVSIWVLGGRIKIPFVGGEKQLALLRYQQGESDLTYRNGEFYLYATCDLPDEKACVPTTFLGVDLGINNIATDSDGTIYSAKHLLNVRHRQRRLRKKLQKKGTRSAKRRLKRLAGKESRFARDTNHCISKKLVKRAQDTQRGIALEDLTGIRDRVPVSRSRREQLHSWSFSQLQDFIDYKAQISRVLVREVDPRNTSRECSHCGYIDKGNRKSQAHFQCLSCGYVSHADVNAAVNISRRATVN